MLQENIIANGVTASLNGYKKQEKLQSPRKQYVPTEEERMEVDNVVYVDDLDSDSDPDDGSPKVIFLHDIDKQLTRVPYSLCNEPSSSTPSTSTEVILYSVPSSLTVPEQRDSVRRAIIETRARMRQKQVDMEAAAAARSSQVNEATGVADSIAAVPEVDMVDAMEIE